jgi:CNT family concentrative nucleoside transporter
MPPRLVSLLGLIVLIALAWVLSNNRRLFPWRTVLWGVALQFIFALFILKTPLGQGIFSGAQNVVSQLNVFAGDGARMVFGALADRPLMEKAFGAGNGVVFAILVTATIILISSLSTLLYHWGVLQRVVAAIAFVMQRAMKTSGSETLAGASNIFLGQTEAALLIKPYIAKMTRSEIMALMTTGMATIATGVMVVYAGLDGMNAGDILTASVLSAPAGLLIAKTMYPETEPSETGERHHFTVEKRSVNSIDALCQGASEGVALAINVLGMLIAFVAVVSLLDALVVWPQQALHIAAPVTLQQFLGWINAPFAWLIGVPLKDCPLIGQILGERVVLNEFIGYLSLSAEAKAGTLDPRSVKLASYALCGFVNFSSIAIQIGGIGALAPERRGDLAQIGLRAMVGGLLACYLTATVVGVLI